MRRTPSVPAIPPVPLRPSGREKASSRRAPALGAVDRRGNRIYRTCWMRSGVILRRRLDPASASRRGQAEGRWHRHDSGDRRSGASSAPPSGSMGPC